MIGKMDQMIKLDKNMKLLRIDILLKSKQQLSWDVKKEIWGCQMCSDEEHLFLDGGFDETNDISCYIMCSSGEYYCHDLINDEDISKPDMNEYKKYISNKSIYF